MKFNNIKNQIDIEINGELVKCEAEKKLPELLTERGLNPRLIAVEYNGEILHRQYWDNTEVKSGDRLEIVTIVGGG